MTTKKIARTKKSTKRAASKPVEAASNAFTAEDQAALTKLRMANGREAPTAEVLLEWLRKAGYTTEQTAEALRAHASDLTFVANRLLPPPKTEQKPDPYEKAHDHVVAVVGEGLVKACDQLGEEIASYMSLNDGGGDYQNVADVLYTLWKLRWELGMTPDAVEVTANPKQAEQNAEGGAS